MTVKIDKKIKGYAVVKPDDQKKSAPQGSFRNEADRRLTIVDVPTPPTASLRWQSRPQFAEGNPCHMYVVDSPEGKFAMVVGHVPGDEVGKGNPFEVWITGENAPRGLAVLAKSLSIDMRSEDRAWLKRKLEALMKTTGESFELVMPNGQLVRAKSAVDAFARLLHFRCDELGAFSEENLKHTPIMNALMSKREPKTNGNGALSWNIDIDNPNTGDEFLVILKECEIDGRTRPFSVWLSGDFPESLEGFAKSLSLDMRVVDPQWVARKLSQLVDYHEVRGELPFAPVPGSDSGKCATYPSTVAYIAAAIQQRFKALGLFEVDGDAVVDSGVVQLDQVRHMKAANQSSSAPKGADCNNCDSIGTVFLLDGCPTCSACGHSKCQ